MNAGHVGDKQDSEPAVKARSQLQFFIQTLGLPDSFMPKLQDLLCVSVAAAASGAQSRLFVVVSSVNTPMVHLASTFMEAQF